MDDAGAAPEQASADGSAELPRRSRQRHLEPQLREPGGAGDGTPFAAFADPDPTADAGEAPSDAAAFRRGTGRGSAQR